MSEQELIPPVQEGEIYKEMLIELIGKEGDGITKVNGFVIIVPYTRKGQTVDIEITKVTKKVAFAKVIG